MSLSDNNLAKNPIDTSSVYAAVGLISGAGVLISSLSPVIVGVMAEAFSFGESQLGDILAAFNVGFTVFAVAALFFIRKINWRMAAVGATIAASMGSLLLSTTSSFQMIAVLFVFLGLATGALYSIGMAVMGDSDDPDRAFGLKLGLEGIPALVLLFAIPTIIAPTAGFSGVAYCLALTMLVLGLGSILIPEQGVKNSGEPVQSENIHVKPTPILSALALLASIVFFSGLIGTWAFLEVIGTQKSFSPEQLGLVLVIGFLLAIVGGFVAALIGNHLGRITPLAAIIVVELVGLYILSVSADLLMFGIGAGLVLFTANFALAYFFGLSAEIDVSGKFVVVSAASISIGGVVGPAIAGRLIENYSAVHLFGFSAACGATSLLLYLLVVVASGTRTSN